MASVQVASTILLAILFAFLASCEASGNQYKDGEKVTVYVNKVGPYFNPHETYHYYQLPVCRPEKVETRSLTLGEILDGDRMAVSLYDVKFKENELNKELCIVTLKDADLKQIKEAIEDLYYFEFVMDNIPLRGFVGHFEEGGFIPHTHKLFLWHHHTFYIEYNKDQIVYANITTRDRMPLNLDDVVAPLEVQFTYSVVWQETKMAYNQRHLRLLKSSSFFPRTLEVHWLSIINSMVLVFLLLGFVLIILMRVLKNDFARYNLDDDDTDEMDQEENGWKIIHTDVFRFPPQRSLLCAMLGVGSQFLTLATAIIIMALLGMFNVHKHGSMNTAAILLYALTSCVSGYVSSTFYKKLGGENWVWNIVLTSSLFTVPFFLIWSVVNSVAWYNDSTQALPFTTILLLLCIWILVGYPLTVTGGIFGKNMSDSFDAPCRTKNIAREIPSVPWFRSGLMHCLVGGFLPFSAISVELYYIFATVWGREMYTLYGILFVVYGILLSVTACISVALTYFQLSNEDYRWWWRSIFSAGSTGIFVFIYAIFYFVKRSSMTGILQTVEFFGFTFLACYVFFLMLGTVSFFASLKFIRYIYRNLKMD
ncbi:transmembrane 9 superfamily member 1-like [Patiria miniata]|uniref:Transmembrane 9 superfamily member n=1 Tax=Patiria miniata TaxID=46514 RepID=A0A913ZK68_PATMI|nr:transmembrane 9 superfamily member 1-like [Patiria miniata]